MIRLSRASTLARLICYSVFAGIPIAAIAADAAAPASNPAESAVLRRIQKNWAARGERFKSYYFAWDAQSVLPKKRGEPVAVTHWECWFKGKSGEEGNDKFRIHTSLADPKVKQGPRAEGLQRAFDGTTTRTLDGDDLVGTIQNGGVIDRSFDPLLFALQPASLRVFDPSVSKIVSNNAHVGPRRCIKLRQGFGAFTFQYWVDPEREDVIAGWELLSGNSPVDFVSIEYRRQHNEWLPARWTVKNYAIAGSPSTVSSVTKSAVNEKFSVSLFVLEFPPGAVVLDKQLKRNYVVQKDGTLKADSSGALGIYETLEQAVDFTIDPQPLKDALAFIAQRYLIKVTIDGEATRKGLIDPAIEVQTKTAAFQLKKLLKQLLAQSPNPLTYKVRDGELLIVPASRPN